MALDTNWGSIFLKSWPNDEQWEKYFEEKGKSEKNSHVSYWSQNVGGKYNCSRDINTTCLVQEK